MKRSSTIFSFVSGKGGVGKSVLAVNLAETLSAQGHRVALIDADFGQGACAVLLNETPQASVLSTLRGKARLLDTLHETHAGVTLVQAVAETAVLGGSEPALFARLDTLLADLRRTHDYILIDAPAGVTGPVRWALDRADLGLLVLVGEPTAVADAYRLVKFIWEHAPDYPLGAVVNFAEDAEDAADVARRFGKITTHFTGQETMYLGWVPFSAAIRQSVRTQCPAVRKKSPLSEAFDALAEMLVQGHYGVPTGPST
ncbi:P-loop NTPase [Rhodocaloribacter sp.]